MPKHTDLRILRTKKSIYDAFLSLLQEKSFNSITVRDITERAFINRNTFYLHYKDKEDLLESLSQKRIQDLHQLISQPYDCADEKYLHNLIVNVLNEIYRNKEFYRVMMKDSSCTYFTERVKDEIIAQMLQSIHIQQPTHQTLFCIEYIVAGFIGAINYYLCNSNETSVERIADLVFQLVCNNALNLLPNSAH